MNAFKKMSIRCGLCLAAVLALANSGCMLVVGAAAGGAAGAAGYAYYKDKKDSDSAVVTSHEPALAPATSSSP